MITARNIVLVLWLMVVSPIAFCQSFEGKIVYKNGYKSKIPNVPDDQFNSMMGVNQVYLMKGGNYKSTVNGTMMQWQLYRSDDNRLYMKMSNSPAVLWKDVSENPDAVQKTEIKKGAETILGHLCDELIVTTTNGTQKFYFSPKIKVDPKLYEQHKFGNMSEVMSKMKSVPLKIIVEMPQFVMESTATEISIEEVDDAEFQLPPNTELQKSPY